MFMDSVSAVGGMTSKERVLCALARAEPDRVPVDYVANPGIDARLKAHFALDAEDDEGLRCMLGVDFRGYGPPYVGPRLHAEVPDRKVCPEYGIRTRWVEHGEGGYWDFCDFSLRDATEEEVAAWPMPSPDDYDYDAVLGWCKAHESYALHAGGAGTGEILNSSGMIFGVERVMMGVLTEDPAWLRWVDRRAAIMLEVTRRTLEAGKGRYDFMWMGEDLGSQKAPLISLESYRRLIRPRHQEFIDLAKSYDLPVMVHTCGSSSWAYPDFIEMGVDAVDTLQPEAVNMSPAYLKKEFGDRLAFHGCISTAGKVSFGTPEEVRQNCREVLEVMMPGGGYCFAPTHALQDNSPTENVLAMYETARELGRY
jgi:uroporphyrinogen decarboxylase